MKNRQMKWTLISETKDGKYNPYKKENEIVMHYQSGTHTVAFHSHPTREWVYVLVKGDKKQATKVINAYLDAGLKQHEYQGGFSEAIKTLYTK